MALTNKPLSTRAIERKILGPEKVKQNKRDPDVYDIIRERLCPSNVNYQFFLFDWGSLISSIDANNPIRKDINLRQVVKNIKRIDWPFNWSSPEFEKDVEGNTITISNGLNHPRVMRIERDLKSKNQATLTIFHNGKEERMAVPLTIKEVHRRLLVFYEGIIIGNPRLQRKSYLIVTLNERARKESERINTIGRLRAIKKSEIDGIPFREEVEGIATRLSHDEQTQLAEVEGNMRNWQYSLNTRGLVKYVLDIKDQGLPASNIEISKVLENLAKNYLHGFPFLKYHSQIKIEYDKLAVEGKMQDYFQVSILKQISLELQYTISTIDEEDLKYYITKRYSDEISKYFIAPTRGPWFSPAAEVVPPIIREYYAYNQIHLRNYLETKLEQCDFLLREYALDKPLNLVGKNYKRT